MPNAISTQFGNYAYITNAPVTTCLQLSDARWQPQNVLVSAHWLEEQTQVVLCKWCLAPTASAMAEHSSETIDNGD